MNTLQPKSLFEIMREEKLAFFTLQSNDQKTDLAKNVEIDDVEVSINRIEKLCKIFAGQQVVIELRKDIAAGRKGLKDKVYQYRVVIPEESQIENFAAPVDPFKNEWQQRAIEAEKKLENFDLKRKIEDLEQKLEDQNSGIDLEQMLSIFTKVQKPQAAKKMTGAAINGSTSRVYATIAKKFLNLDQDAPKVLKAIYRMAKEDPDTYSQYKSILLNVSNG